MNSITASTSLTSRIATVAVALLAATMLLLSAGSAHANNAHAVNDGATERHSTVGQLGKTKALLKQKGAGRRMGHSAKRPPGHRAKVTSPARRSLSGYTLMSYCFRHGNGSPYTYDTSLQAYFNGAWHNISYQRANVNGCGTYLAVNGYYWRVRAYTRVITTFSGTTGWLRASGGSVHLGTWWVYG